MNTDYEFDMEEFDLPADFESAEELSRFRPFARSFSPRVNAPRANAPRANVPRGNVPRGNVPRANVPRAIVPRPRPRPVPPRRLKYPPPIGGRRIYLYAPESPAASEYVRWVQTMLNQALNLQLPVDGVMSVETRSAIRSFQTQQGLPADGIVGPPTEDALIAASQIQPPQPQDMASELEAPAFEADASEWESEVNRSSRDYIMWVQRSLNKIMGLNLAVDGISGTHTRSAVRSFQQQKGLTVDGIVGPQTEAALIRAGAGTPPGASTSTPAPYVPWPSPSSGSGSIHYGKGWGGSEGVADAAKGIAASMGVPVTSEKRDLAKTIEVGSSTGSDHYTGNTTAFATDFGVTGPRGDELARAIATKYGIPQSAIGTFNRYTIQVGDRRYRLQLLWKVAGHYDHVHLGIRLA